MSEKKQHFTVKTLSQINQAFSEEMEIKREAQSLLITASTREEKSFLRVISDVLFYVAILAILFSVLSVDISEGTPRNILGYSYFTVMSSSMKGEIPKGALIIIRKTEHAQLKKGDNITFLKSDGSTVTHKIIDILNNGSGTGLRFQTKGVNNSSPDNYMVDATDVLGKVVFTFPVIGSLIDIINDNIHIVLILFLICSLLSFLLRGVIGKKSNMEASK